MKKSLLFAAALSLAVVANAQVARSAGTATQCKAVATQQMKNAKIEHRTAQHATTAIAPRAKKVPANSAYYQRPKGTMYVNWDKTGSGYIMPFLNTKPYDEVTYRNASTATGNPSWGYWIYDVEAGARDSLVSQTQDLTITYGYEYEDAPYLTVGSSTYVLQGHRVNRTTGAIEHSAVSGVAAVPNSMEIFSDQETNMIGSAHYYGSSNRFGTDPYGWTYYSGAPGPDYDPDAPANQQDRSGHWFGKNYGDWNVFGCGFEKPISPYVLNKIYFWATAVEVSEDVDLEARVYRVEDLPAYSDTTVARIDPALLNEENLIATGRTTITTEMNEDGSPLLEFTLYETDPELGLEYETTPQINDAIVILIVGMDQDAIVSMSGLITTDDEDEGVGEVTYMGQQQDGVITACIGLNNFFTSGQLMAGSSIFVDVTRPFMTFNYSFEEGEYTFPAAGGKLAYNLGGQVLEGISFFAYSPKADWVVTDVNGNDVPDWLTITLADEEENGEWTGVVNANVTAAALPQGVDGRRAEVRFAINGAYIDYLFIQGVDPGPIPPGIPGDCDNNGTIDIDDVNIIINIMLQKEGFTVEAYPLADTNGDGVADVDDMNYDINVILGKN